MDFTRFPEILSAYNVTTIDNILDVNGTPEASPAEHTIRLRESESFDPVPDAKFEAICLRYALSLCDDPYAFLQRIVNSLCGGGLLVIQDWLMPDTENDAEYINGLLHLLDKKHRKSFAQYAWDGLVLDVGLTLQQVHYKSIPTTLTDWRVNHQIDDNRVQRVQIIARQAPESINKILQIQYAGTPYLTFTVHEMILVAQKEANDG